MAKKVEDKLLDHDYDGIQEFDNPMPAWWLQLFYFSIAWAVIYLLFFHVLGIGDLSHEEYMKQMDPNWVNPHQTESAVFGQYQAPYQIAARDWTPRMRAEMSGKAFSTAAASVEEITFDLQPLTEAVAIEAGKSIFATNCASCHGQAGEGGIGPNLTDNYWLHGEGDINGVARIITYGVPAKGMIAWNRTLSLEQIHQVGSYVLTLMGTNPPNGKAPQGELFE